MPLSSGQRQFPCKQCGANLVFEPGQTCLKCPYCQTENEIAVAAAPVEELDFYSALSDRSAAGETRELDERQLVQLANSAWAAGLCLLMAGDREAAADWLRRSAERYRESWNAGSATAAWGRPIGAIKALLIAGDDAGDAAQWTLETCLGVRHLDTSISPIGWPAIV